MLQNTYEDHMCGKALDAYEENRRLLDEDMDMFANIKSQPSVQGSPMACSNTNSPMAYPNTSSPWGHTSGHPNEYDPSLTYNRRVKDWLHGPDLIEGLNMSQSSSDSSRTKSQLEVNIFSSRLEKYSDSESEISVETFMRELEDEAITSSK